MAASQGLPVAMRTAGVILELPGISFKVTPGIFKLAIKIRLFSFGVAETPRGLITKRCVTDRFLELWC